MAARNSRRQDGTAPIASQTGKPSMGNVGNAFRADVIRRLSQAASGLLGAIEDHRKWINSDRARVLETIFGVAGRFLTYAAYVSLTWLAFRGFVGIRKGLAAGAYVIPEHLDGSRVALFNILAAGLAGPMVIIAIGFGIGWVYNVTTATANRALPRFTQPLIHPSIMFVIVAGFAASHSAVTATVAKGYLHAKANIEAASPQEAVSVKVIEIPRLDASRAPEAMEHDSSSERELVRLKSMFNSGQPCPVADQGTVAAAQPEVVRPEPGLAPRHDCPVEKQPLTNKLQIPE